MYDIAIIGAGVVGSLIAREFSKYKLKICILEKNNDVATGASAANSGIVHAGFDAAVGSLKAKFNVLGNKMMPQITKDLGVKYENNGSLLLAFNEKEMETIKILYDRGIKNGVTELYILNKEDLKKLEPNLSDNVIGALHAKTGGIVCPYGLAISACGNAMDNGADLKLNFEVAKIDKNIDVFSIVSKDNESIEAKTIINCAGIFSDKVAQLVKDNSFKIGARKGEYILLDRESRGFVSHTLFTTPNEKGKGILVSNTVDGNILLGPTSEETEKDDKATTQKGLSEVINKAGEMVSNIPLYNTITSFAGLRAYADRHDFIIEESSVCENFYNVAGIESPGLTSAPAIAEYVVNLYLQKYNDTKVNETFNGKRLADNHFKKMSIEEKNKVIAENKSFGKIICRCEEITLGEIEFEASRNPKPQNLDALKRRTRAGMGRCQSGFCQPYLVEILKNQLNVDYTDITKSGKNSYVITGRTK